MTQGGENPLAAFAEMTKTGAASLCASSKKGRAGLSCAIEVMTEIKAEYAGILCTDGPEQLKPLMAGILDQTDAQGTFGLD